MEKILFEDARLTSQAKITIDGVDHLVTEAEYSGGTDLNANTFNQLQDNVENAIDELAASEELIYNGKITSNTTINLDTSKYKRLLITCCIYDYLVANTGGTSNVMILDLTKTGEEVKDYVATNTFAYIKDNFTIMTPVMSVACVVNSSKTTFTPYFAYNDSVLDNSQSKYYVSKIIGIK